MEAKKGRGAYFGANNGRQWVVRNWVGKRCQSGSIDIAAVAAVAGEDPERIHLSEQFPPQGKRPLLQPLRVREHGHAFENIVHVGFDDIVGLRGQHRTVLVKGAMGHVLAASQGVDNQLSKTLEPLFFADYDFRQRGSGHVDHKTKKILQQQRVALSIYRVSTILCPVP